MTQVLRIRDPDYRQDPGITGFQMATVIDDAIGCVKFWRVPAGWGLGQLGIEENLHRHDRVYEYAAVLEGDFPHVEVGADGESLERIRFHAGDLMIRPPGSVHGLHAEQSVLARCDMLYWNTGRGTSILDPDYATETTDLLASDLRLKSPADRSHAHARCRIIRAGRVGNGAPAIETLSLPDEPFTVRVQRLEVGESLELESFLDADTRFAMLWTGDCRIGAACTADFAKLAAGSILLGALEEHQRSFNLVADTLCCWLQVSRSVASHEPSLPMNP
jgi:hypothetical protein